MAKKIIYLITIFIMVWIFFYSQKLFISEREYSQKAEIKIGKAVINVDIAYTQEEQYKGLSGREFLKENEGMIFIYKSYKIPSFVMRDMKFSIDIIWIRDNVIVDISKNLPLPVPGKPLIEYKPISDINRVLEVLAGFTDRGKIQIGDTLEIFFPKT